jgi:hypothetical protein
MKFHESTKYPEENNYGFFAGSTVVEYGKQYVVSHYCIVCDLAFHKNYLFAECPVCKEQIKMRKFGDPMDGR